MNIVITGSTRGIGLGLAREFMARGHSVMISGRDAETVATVTGHLATTYPAARAHGCNCDVTKHDDVQALWDEASRNFGTVDIWINNAGRNTPKCRIDEMEFSEVEDTLDTNLLGMMRGSLIALKGMRNQGSGWIFNMEGFGSDGMIGLEQVPYGLSKYGLRYFTKALARTVETSGVKVGYLSPGIVTTEMAVPKKDDRGEFFYKNARVLNILADHVETVTPWLVEEILNADRNGAAIRWLTLPKVALRFLSSPFRKRTVIDDAVRRLDEEQPDY